MRPYSLACLLALGVTAWSGAVQATDLNNSIVRVVGTRDSGQAISTGFFFRVHNQIGVLTALHGVVGASSITVKNESCEFQVQLSLVDVAHDLAFLSGVTEGANTPSLATEASPTAKMDKVIGYPQGILTQKSEPMTTREVMKEMLIGLIPGNLLAQLQSRKSPDLATEVLSLRGLLQSGYSGAPILSSNGGVLGVGSGGLAGGFANINWAIPIEAATWTPVQSAAPELNRLAALPTATAFQVLSMSAQIEKIDLAKVELRRLRATVVPIRKSTNLPFDGTLSIQEGSGSKVTYACPSTRCPDGTINEGLAPLLIPGFALQAPGNLAPLSSPGLQQYLLLDELVLSQFQQTQRAVENHTVPADADGYRAVLDRARTTCHLDADTIDSTLGRLSRLRALESNALFWGGQGGVYRVFNPSRLALFGHYLITIAMASGETYDQVNSSSVRDVTAMISAEYEKTYSALNDLEKGCALAVSPITSKNIKIKLHRPGFDDCPSLPDAARLKVKPASGEAESSANILGGCRAEIPVSKSMVGLAKLDLLDASPYVLADREKTYSLEARQWEASVTASPGTRTVVSLFSYAGQCRNLTQVHSMFESILSSKARSLRGLFDVSDQKFDYLNDVNVISTHRSSEQSVNEIHGYWRSNNLLQVLSGICTNKPGGEVMLSSIFSGDFAGTLPEPYIVSLRIVDEEFRTNRDLHSATMLFGLAQEAQRRGVDQHIVIAVLERAFEITTGIPDEARSPLLAAINRSLSAAGAPAMRLTQ